MQEASYTLRLSKFQSLPKTGLTPAELVLLHVLHSANVGEDPVIDIKVAEQEASTVVSRTEAIPAIGVEGEAGYEAAFPEKVETRPRTAVEELRRLRSKYGHLRNKKGDNLLKLLWPGLDAKLPQKFEDVKTAELQYDGVEVGTTDFGTSGGAAVNP